MSHASGFRVLALHLPETAPVARETWIAFLLSRLWNQLGEQNTNKIIFLSETESGTKDILFSIVVK